MRALNFQLPFVNLVAASSEQGVKVFTAKAKVRHLPVRRRQDALDATGLIAHLNADLLPGFAPVIFCRYIATAHYLHQHLKARFPGVTVDVVTGELAPEERKARVAALGEADHRLLVATDCLSVS